ncbi:hypothetical protein ACSSWA_13615 [Melioribacter sp. Ez-97]|uniref:hypothetical protein n=1 Tax=Melioribacter sp. Ez-97 TaxID=3423434 RepID=UPI003ED9863B
MFKRILVCGISSGIVMGIMLFIGGAIVSRVVYGPEFAPPGKFKPEQLNPFYFIWTKIVIGIFFGLLFAFVYEKLPLSGRFRSSLQGVLYGAGFWLIISLWDISHPLVYGSAFGRDRIFWLIYTFIGFVALGFSFGFYYKRQSKPD